MPEGWGGHWLEYFLKVLPSHPKVYPGPLVWPKRANEVGQKFIKAAFLDAVLRSSDPERKLLAHCLQGSGVSVGWGCFPQT